MAWIDLFICYLFGIFGVHKFREKKIALGLLYLFTFGLFGFGWLYDCIRYLIVAIKSLNRGGASDNNQFTTGIATNTSHQENKPHSKHSLLPNALLCISFGFLILVLTLFALLGGKSISNNVDNSNLQLSSTNSSTTNTQHTHTFSPATCLEPQKCSCGATEGKALGHNWINATCSTPKTCSVCKATEGSTAGHTWKSATCTLPKTCSNCGATEGYAKNHKYSNGKCTACGAKDPNHTSEVMVWIPTNGGERYHSNKTCSKMENPEYVTKSEAISRGFTPCGRCKPS